MGGNSIQVLILVSCWLLMISRTAGQLLGSNKISVAVRDKALPLGVSQIIMAPTNNIVGTNVEGPLKQNVPAFGASVAWTPTTTGMPRVIIGSVGAMTSINGRIVYGAAYVYICEQYSFSLLQTILPPDALGEPGLSPFTRYGAMIYASQNSVSSPVLTGTNLWIGQSFASVQDRSDESVYFYSASTLTTGLTRENYRWQQTIRIQVQQSCNFGSAMVVSSDDLTVVVGAPAYPGLSPVDSAYNLAGPTAGRAFVFAWNSATKSYSAQSILTAAQAGYAREVGFGVAVAMSGNTFVVGALGSADVTGQLTVGLGNLYVYTIQAPQSGLSGEQSALSTSRFSQVIAGMPVSSPFSISMVGNYICVGVQDRAEVVILLSTPITPTTPTPNYNQRTVIGGLKTATANSGMGQIVVAQMVDDLLYVYMGQPNRNVGAIFVAAAPNSIQVRDLGIQGGLEPGFGTSIAFNAGGNYLFAGNFLNQPHVLVISIYFETFGLKALKQRLISNDVQTAGSGVFSNFGAVVAGQSNSAQSIICVGASLGPTLMGRVYIYSLLRSSRTFSLQAEIVGSQGTNFGAAVATMLSTGSDIAIVVGAPSINGITQRAYVDIFIAPAQQGASILHMTKGIQRLLDPMCIPLSDQFSCGSNYGGTIVVDGQRVVVGAHNFGVQAGTGRVYVYVADLTRSKDSMFGMAQTLQSPASEFGFGVALAMGPVDQNPNTPPVPLALQTTVSRRGVTTTTTTLLFVAAMGLPRTASSRFPFTQSQGVGMCYIYVNTGNSRSPFSQLQVLTDTPVELPSSLAGTGAAQSIAMKGQDLYIGTIWRNQVRFYRYNGKDAYKLAQTISSPYGERNFGGGFGVSLQVAGTNRALIVGAVGNGTAFMYLNKAPVNQAGKFELIRVLSARPLADQFGMSVAAAGDSVIIGAPGANIASIYPLPDILKLPEAKLSAAPTPRSPNSAPVFFIQPTFSPVTRSPTARNTKAPTISPTIAPSNPQPTLQPTMTPSTFPTPGTGTGAVFADQPQTGGGSNGGSGSQTGGGGYGGGNGGLQPDVSSSSEEQKDKGASKNLGATIAGVVVGVVVLIGVVLFFLYCKNRHNDEKLAKQLVAKMASSGDLNPPLTPFFGDHRPSMSRGSAGAFDHHQVYNRQSFSAHEPASPHFSEHGPSRPSMSRASMNVPESRGSIVHGMGRPVSMMPPGHARGPGGSRPPERLSIQQKYPPPPGGPPPLNSSPAWERNSMANPNRARGVGGSPEVERFSLASRPPPQVHDDL